jgi:hypothetical protein
MKANTLLDFENPKYLRRLAKELNAHSIDGFYQNNRRFNRARATKNGLFGRLIASGNPNCWIHLWGNQTFADPYGREIVANRAA